MVGRFQTLLSNSTCAATERRDGGGVLPGRAVQLDPFNLTLKPPGTKRLKLECDDLLSNVGFNFNLHRYNPVEAVQVMSRICGRG